jgi:hypothetical protein
LAMDVELSLGYRDQIITVWISTVTIVVFHRRMLIVGLSIYKGHRVCSGSIL